MPFLTRSLVRVSEDWNTPITRAERVLGFVPKGDWRQAVAASVAERRDLGFAWPSLNQPLPAIPPKYRIERITWHATYLLTTAATTLFYGPHGSPFHEQAPHAPVSGILLGVAKLAARSSWHRACLISRNGAYAGLVFDAAAAIASRLLARGDPVLVLPHILVGTIAIAPWAGRPACRRAPCPQGSSVLLLLSA